MTWVEDGEDALAFLRKKGKHAALAPRPSSSCSTSPCPARAVWRFGRDQTGSDLRRIPVVILSHSTAERDTCRFLRPPRELLRHQDRQLGGLPRGYEATGKILAFRGVAPQGVIGPALKHPHDADKAEQLMVSILLIDDDTDFSETLALKLQQLDHRVQVFDNAEDGLQLLSTKGHGIDLVLVDNRMPNMTGLEFLETLMERDIRVPAILMTSAHHDQTVIQALKVGAFAYVIKPRADDELIDQFGPIILESLEITRRPKAVELADCDEQDDNSLIVGRASR